MLLDIATFDIVQITSNVIHLIQALRFAQIEQTLGITDFFNDYFFFASLTDVIFKHIYRRVSKSMRPGTLAIE